MAYGFIYGLYDSETEELRYIGQTVRPLKVRLRAHMSKGNLKRNSHVANWLNSTNKTPIIKKLAEAETKEELDSLEIRTISEWQKKGARLTNVARGGRGNAGFSHSPETKKRMSKIRKGKKKSEEWKENISKAKRANPMPEDERRRIGERFSTPKSEEHRRKLSDALAGRKLSAETRRKMSLAKKGKPPNNVRGKISTRNNENG